MLDRNTCASAGRRAAGAFVDLVVAGFAVFLFSVLVDAFFPDDGLDPSTTSEMVGGALVLAGVVVTPVVYGTLLMRWGGSTLGQRVTGTRTVSVRTPDGLTTGAAVQRAIVWCLGGWCLGLSLRSASRDQWRQAWHDRLAGTVVVDAEQRDAVVETVRAALADGIEVLPRTAPVPSIAPSPRAPEPVADPPPVLPVVDVNEAPVTALGPVRPPADAAVPLLEAHQWLLAAASLRVTDDDHPDRAAWQAMAVTLAAPGPGLQWCDELAVHHPENAGVHAARALYLLRDGDTEHAQRSLAQAQSLGTTELVRLAQAVFSACDGSDARDVHRDAYLNRGGDPYLLATLTASVCLQTESVRGREPALEAVRMAPDDARANALAVHVATSVPGPELARELIWAWAERAVELAPNTKLAAMAVAAAVEPKVLRKSRAPESLQAWNAFYSQDDAHPVDPPSGSVFDVPSRCACATVADLRGELAVAYAQQHLVTVGSLGGLASVEARCPDTQVHWLGLEGSEPESMGGALLVKVPSLGTEEPAAPRRASHAGSLERATPVA
jgi:uncharacterized RDD family membrane protein YckC